MASYRRMSGNLSVTAEQLKLAAHWSYLAFPFLCLAILALHQWLRLRSSRKRLATAFRATKPNWGREANQYGRPSPTNTRLSALACMLQMSSQFQMRPKLRSRFSERETVFTFCKVAVSRDKRPLKNQPGIAE